MKAFQQERQYDRHKEGIAVMSELELQDLKAANVAEANRISVLSKMRLRLNKAVDLATDETQISTEETKPVLNHEKPEPHEKNGHSQKAPLPRIPLKPNNFSLGYLCERCGKPRSNASGKYCQGCFSSGKASVANRRCHRFRRRRFIRRVVTGILPPVARPLKIREFEKPKPKVNPGWDSEMALGVLGSLVEPFTHLDRGEPD